MSAACFAAAMGFAMLEGACRFYLWRMATPAVFTAHASIEDKFARMISENAFVNFHPLLISAPRPGLHPWMDGHIRINSHGFRGAEIVLPKPANEFRIACIGGSTTLDEDVQQDDQAYPARLEAELRERGYNVTVINAGMSNHASNQSLITYALRVSYCEPDMIVLYEGINDWLRRLEWPPETHKSDSSGNERLREFFDGDQTMIERMGQSAFLRLLLPRFGFRFPDADIEPTEMFLPKTYAWTYWEQLMLGTYPDGIFREVDVMTMLNVNQPVYFEHNLRSIIGLARHYGDQVLMCTVTGAPVWTEARTPESKGWYLGLQEMNGVTSKVGREMNVPVFDLANAMPHDDTYWNDPMHNTASGSTMRAALIAQFMIEHELIPARYKKAYTGGN